jgi:tetratricopeptide (TPR) repeat protein
MSGSTDALLRRAQQQVQGKQFESAETTLTALLQLDPRNVRAKLLLSQLELRADRYNSARRLCLDAHALAPTDAEIAYDLFQRLRGFTEHAAMVATAERLLSMRPLDPARQMQLASSLGAIGAAELAEQVAAQMRKRAPNHPATLLTEGYLATHRGDFVAAEAALERGIAVEPRLAMAHWLLSRLRSYGSDDHHLPRLHKLVADPVLTPADAALAGFALHKELHDSGDHAAAWRALERACAHKRRITPYDEPAMMALFDRLEAQTAGAIAAAPAPDAPTPIFIVGMHRSGTTLLERMLGRHPQVEDCGETYRFTAQLRAAADHQCRGVLDERILERSERFDHAAIGRGYVASCGWRLGAGKTHFTEKLPSNFLALGLIKRALPRARFLHMQRDPLDTCLSNLRELFSDACAYSYDQQELGRYYLRYRRLMAHWHALYPGEILDVRYEDLVADPLAQARRVLDYCGLPWRDDVVDVAAHTGVVTTASAVQVRSPIHGRSVGAWRAYAEELAPLRAILGA